MGYVLVNYWIDPRAHNLIHFPRKYLLSSSYSKITLNGEDALLISNFKPISIYPMIFPSFELKAATNLDDDLASSTRHSTMFQYYCNK